jgi:hypothetical protein
MDVKGSFVVGCTHQMPAFANSTIFCPARAPSTRPAIGATLSGPPSAAGGIVVISIDGVEAACRVAQPLSKKRTNIPNANAKIDRRAFGRDHFMAS